MKSWDFILKTSFRYLFSSSFELDSFWSWMRLEETGVPHSRCTFRHKNTSPWKDKLTGRGQWKINVLHLTWQKCSFYSLKPLEFWEFFKLTLLYEYFYLNRPFLHLFLKELRPLVWFHPAAVFSPFFCFAVKMYARLSFPTKPLLVFLLTVSALSGLRRPWAAAGRTCADTRQVYAEMGYSTGNAPQTQISGKVPAYIKQTF